MRATLSAVILAGLMFASLAANGPALAGGDLSLRAAYDRARAGEIVLVDIRSPAEWRKTGVATVARPISMHEDGFFDQLEAALGGDRSRPVALICAVGGRSLYMQAQLAGRGYSNVWNVPQGMIGGRNGPGWIGSGLPVMAYSE